MVMWGRRVPLKAGHGRSRRIEKFNSSTAPPVPAEQAAPHDFQNYFFFLFL
jgi:hypothetical protein